ncbi:MAG TPA: HEAT repeat domain-containing protein [candidate division Zixibacteria bacterium]|nr:HEAT repeat domain-containing protein [candidate division Zixibacteria bacterium]
MSRIPIDKNILLLFDSDPKKRRNAAEALGQSLNKGAVKPLLNQLEKETVIEVRRAIILSLSFLGNEEALPIILDVLKNDSDIETRRNAAGGLRFFGEKINSVEIFELLLNETDIDIQNVLVGTIIFLQDDSLIPRLIKVFSKESYKNLKGCFLEIIGSYDDSRTKELLLECVQPEIDDDLRLIATRAMGKMNDIKLIPHLYEVYKSDSCKEIRDCAFKILEELSIALQYSTIEQMVLDYLDKIKEPET